MEPNLSDYPERLFKQPDFELLFKYFPQESFPTLPDVMNNNEQYNFIGGDHYERLAFWDAFRDAYSSAIIEESHVQKGQNPLDNTQGSNIDRNGLLTWKAKGSLTVNPERFDLVERYLNEEKDLSAEIFAVHKWLTFNVKINVNPLRKLPELIFQEFRKGQQNPNSHDIKTTTGSRNDKNLERLIKEYETELKFLLSKTEAEKLEISERLKYAKELQVRLKSSMAIERQFRKTYCNYVLNFLTEMNVCSSITGIRLVGAFLIFSSGLTFRKTKGIPNLVFDLEFDAKFKQSVSD
jgi:hypothetical protein